ncbi:hypothetical protein ACVRZD_04650 [Streptococcus hongkongensis]|nr:hypothetical protein NC01_01745 [Streptococcus uberis]
MTFEEIRNLISHLDALCLSEFTLKTEKIDLIFKKNHSTECIIKDTKEKIEILPQAKTFLNEEESFSGTILEFEDWET